MGYFYKKKIAQPFIHRICVSKGKNNFFKLFSLLIKCRFIMGISKIMHYGHTMELRSTYHFAARDTM